MTARASLAVGLVLMVATPVSAAPEPGPFVPKMTPVEIPGSTEAIPGMQTIAACDDSYAATYIPNVPYVTRGTTPLRLQILKPRDVPPLMGGKTTKAPLRPLILYVQGSGWGPQDLYSAIPQLSELAHRGFVVASVEYRPSTVATAPAQIQDVKTAIRFLRAHAADYDIDPDSVGIWGDFLRWAHGCPRWRDGWRSLLRDRRLSGTIGRCEGRSGLLRGQRPSDAGRTAKLDRP